MQADVAALPNQAVILAGGRGTRLAPLTDTKPKPMIEFHGKPFLEYLITMLREQGIRKVLLLLGYLPDVIQRHFGNGSRWGVSIDYAVSDVDHDTGLRLKLALSKIDPINLLLYCDNYWPMNLAAMWRQFKARDLDAQITVYRNLDGYTKDNLRVDANASVVAYDKKRTQPGLAGVDIGYVLLKRSVIESLPAGNVSFEREAYPQLVSMGKLGAYVSDHRYYSVGSHERLPLTEAFLARRPTVLLDRDGVLNKCMPRATYVCSWSQWVWLPGSLEALRRLREAGYRVLVITNQPGIARGALSEDDLTQIHRHMSADAKHAGGEINAVYRCPHNWDEGCNCRKPRPGLLFQAQREHGLDLSRTYFIGDDERDAQAAQAAGCPWALVSQERSLLDVTTDLLAGTLESRPLDVPTHGLQRAA
jgi:histidinol-phosphate phosphatase family protein